MNRGAVALLALGAAGCGDTVQDVGDLGRLVYSLHVDYELEGGLRDNTLVTGHTQTFDVLLTRKGARQADHPGLIRHEVTPASDAVVLFDPGDEDDDDPPALFLTAWVTGAYRIESWLDGELFDTITVDFARPTALDVHTWQRPPGAPRFESVSADAAQTVTEGTQVAFLTIPLDKRGRRLVGDYALDVSWDPEWAAIQTWNVFDVYEEEGVFGSIAEESLVFVDPATVTVSLTDEPNGMVDTRVFEVVDAGALRAR